MSLSKHQKDLPDLCLLAILSQLSLVDRFNASQVCPQWYYRVKEANKTVRSLNIAFGTDMKGTENSILWSKQTIHVLRVALLKLPDDPSQLPQHRLTSWNCVQLGVDRLNSATLRQITSTFSHITELIWILSDDQLDEQLFGLVKILKGDSWKRQLGSLEIIKASSTGFIVNHFALKDAIKSLPALKHLQIFGIDQLLLK